MNGLCTCPCVTGTLTLGDLGWSQLKVFSLPVSSNSNFNVSAALSPHGWLASLRSCSQPFSSILPHSPNLTLSFYLLLSPRKHILLTSQVTSLSLSPLSRFPPPDHCVLSSGVLPFWPLGCLCFFFWALSSHSE